MRNYVIINGVSSLTIPGLAIRELPAISKTLMRNQKEEIDGRDGDIITELGYSAYDKTMTIGLYGSYDINQIIAFFNQKGTIVFSDEADKYYNFTILEKIDYDKLVKFRTATVKMHCQPFKYPVSETPVEIEAEYITAQGEDITLNNTGVAPLEIGLKGDTYQADNPTPSNPQDIEVVTGDNTIKISNKNLINMVEANKGINTTGGITTNVNYLGVEDYIECKPNTTYTITFEDDIEVSGNIAYLYLSEKAKDGTFISRTGQGTSRTFTTGANTYYIFPYLNRTGFTFTEIGGYIQLEYGNQATDYTPHQEQNYEINLGSLELCKIGTYQDYIYKSGSSWKIHREIGKVVLDGSNKDKWSTQDNQLTNSWRYYTTSVIPNAVPNVGLSNKFISVSSSAINTVDSEAFCRINQNQVAVRLNKTRATTLNEFKDWVEANPFNVHYVLATPTEEQVTNAELIEQLEAILNAVSYEDQTNITQDNDNLPFILDVSALKKGTDETVINNIGNIYAKPVIALVGNGTIGLYLNNVQLLSIDMSTYNEITIDTNNMEAYDPNTSQLRNRQVIGDYSSLKLQPGNNTLSFSGDLTSATITNWKRWL